MPPGGPRDTTPPRLAATQPDSGAVGLAGRRVLRFTFSEKMNRQPAQSWLRTYPAREVKKTSWSRATEATVEFFEPLPADTVIVVEILPGLSDAHRVASNSSYRFPLATGDSIPDATLSGAVVQGDTALAGAAVELYAVPADTVKWYQQDPVRRTVTDELGRYRFEWLPSPGGPWLLRAFADTDHNLRAGEKESKRLSPDTLSIAPGQKDATAATLTLYPWNEPGTLRAGPFAAPAWPAPVGAFALAVSQSDTGWSPTTLDTVRNVLGWLDPAAGGEIRRAPAGPGRVLVFVDLDADSTFSAVPDSLWGAAAAARTDTVAWFLEPWGLVEGIELEPGLAADFTVPALGDSLVSWTAPPSRPAPRDTVAAAADPAAVQPPDSLATEPPHGETE